MAEFKVGDKVRYRGMIAEVVDPRLYGKKVQDGYVYIEYYDKNEKSYCGEGVKKTDLVAANSRALNDKWIDDFHVIVTSGKPDASLLSALKDKATAWKLSKKNFSDRTAADRHNAAESKVYDIARRLGAKVIQQGAVMKVVMPNSSVCNSTNAARSPLYTGKSREVIDKITQGKYIGGAVGTVYYNPNGPFKWMINSSGWVYVAQPSRLNVLGDRRFGWKVFRVEKDGMLKQTNYHDFDSIQEAQRAFDELKSINSTNPVVIKAMNSVATNAKSMDRWIFDIMLHQRMGDHGKGAEDYMRQNREQIENDVGKDGFRKLCSKFGNTLAYNARNHIVRKAMNAVACNSSIDDALAEAERNKYDSVVLFQKVIGSGTLFPDKFKLDGGYDCEDAVRAAVKTGKYNEAIFYKNGAIKKRIGLNSAG